MYKRTSIALLTLSLAPSACSDDIGGGGSSTGSAAQAIFGGVEVDAADPVASSTIALLEGDGEQICSGTLITPRLILSAAHCFATFTPYYVSFGTEVAQKTFWTDDLGDRDKFPHVREIESFAIHPDYDPSATRDNAEESRPPNDVAIAVIAGGAPDGLVPARVIAPTSALTTDITLAGFGAFPDYDPLDPAPPRLRKVNTFIGELLLPSKMLKDGPNPGRGSCVRDSGGSVYLRTGLGDRPVLVGNVVSGPYDCSEGLGYDSDLRHYVTWIERTFGVTLAKVAIDSRCGNGELDAGEVCDGDTLACGEIDASYTAGTAACDVQCTGYDLSGCAATPGLGGCVRSACEPDDLPLAIPDRNTTGASSSIHVEGVVGPIEKVIVSAEVTHTYRGDLELTLISPGGAQYRLHDRTGGSADDLSIAAELDAAAGEIAAGQWRLVARDLASGDTGSITSWSLQLIPRRGGACGDGAVCANSARLAIPDNRALGTTSEIEVSAFSGVVDRVAVAVNIAHTYRGDLRVRLVAPSGLAVTLFDRAGGSADDLSLELDLDDFEATSPVGRWQLIVSDHAARDVGSLIGWSLRFTEPAL